MLAKQLLNTDFTPIHPSSPISAALAKMDAWQSDSIPVVEPTTRKNIGCVLFENIAEASDESQPISTVELKKPIHAFENQHVFEVARQMLLHEIRLLPVVDQTETYLGVIEKKRVLEALSEMLNITTAGSVITIEMPKVDFTLSRLIHLIETEGAKILGLTITRPAENDSLVLVSLKINHEDTSAITSSLQRHGFVTSTENRHDLTQIDFTSRADELMRYLDV